MSVQGKYPIPAKYGDRVRFRQQVGSKGLVVEGEGVFFLAWLGMEECWEVRADDGRRIALYPCFGDSMEPIVCEDCGAVGYGNAVCETCHCHWQQHNLDGGCPVCKRRDVRTALDKGGSVSDSITQSHIEGPQGGATMREGETMTTYAKHGDPDYASVTARGCEEAGEPVFLLRAQDQFAPAAILRWAELASTVGMHEMAAEARRIALRMYAWPERKTPDA